MVSHMSATDLTTDSLPSAVPSAGLIGWAERGLVPDALVRYGIRQLCARRLQEESGSNSESSEERYQRQLRILRTSPIAIHTGAANAQHYELPPDLFRLCLGRRLKYSCAYYARGAEPLDQAEEAMLALYGERAELADDQTVLELGCGWGSLTFWMAEHFPRSRITAVTNSRLQRAYIEAESRARGIANVQVLLADVTRVELPQHHFDRCVSIEMFEHMRNYEMLLARIARWLRRDGKLFVHIFAHRSLLYPFESEGEDNWLGRYFFTGGLMPAADTLLWFQRDLSIERRWLIDGTHYQRTAEAWLANYDRNRERIRQLLLEAYGAAAAPLWFHRWRIFWMACAELFGYANGTEWLVAHYRFGRCS
jgi:cyclopropane-fatty-acyl-phospholipid synthase